MRRSLHGIILGDGGRVAAIFLVKFGQFEPVGNFCETMGGGSNGRFIRSQRRRPVAQAQIRLSDHRPNVSPGIGVRRQIRLIGGNRASHIPHSGQSLP